MRRTQTGNTRAVENGEQTKGRHRLKGHFGQGFGIALVQSRSPGTSQGLTSFVCGDNQSGDWSGGGGRHIRAPTQKGPPHKGRGGEQKERPDGATAWASPGPVNLHGPDASPASFITPTLCTLGGKQAEQLSCLVWLEVLSSSLPDPCPR
ncbi:unnamed protein product [Arctogadus glacialis]